MIKVPGNQLILIGIGFDIKGLFENIDHELLMRAVGKHCQVPWVLLYIERWLKEPMQDEEGHLVE